ncbi:MAG: hypothetical protein ACI9YR_002953, partial [Bacteroidia bacterium]
MLNLALPVCRCQNRDTSNKKPPAAKTKARAVADYSPINLDSAALTRY